MTTPSTAAPPVAAPTAPTADEASFPIFGNEAYERLRAQYEALPRSAILPANVDVGDAVCRVLGIAHTLAPHAAQIAAAMPDVPAPLETLKLHALATGYLHRQVKQGFVSPTAKTIARDARETHARLRAAIVTLAAWNELDPYVARKLGRARSDLGIAAEFDSLVRTLRARLPAVERLTPFRAADLTRAIECGYGFLESKAKNTVDRIDVIRTARMNRRRAFTLMKRAYDRIRLLVAALGPAWGVRLDPIPPLRTGLKRKKKPTPPVAPSAAGEVQ